MVGMADGYAQAKGGPTLVNLHTAPGVGNAMGAIFNAQANHSPLVITAGQQARSLITLQANLTNRDATRMPHPLVKWSYEPPRAEDVPPALARAIHARRCRPRARRSSRSRWTTGTPRSTTPTSRAAIDAHVTGRGRRRPRGDRRRSRGGSRRRRTPSWSPGPDVDASGGWEAAVALAERQRLPVLAIPAPGGGRLGFPEGHPQLPRRAAARRSGRSAETLAGHDLILVVGSSVFPYYPNIPGPLLPEGAELVAITSDPDEAARAPMGDAIVADVRLTLERLLERGRRVRPRAAANRCREPDGRASRTRSPGTAAMHALADAWPEDGIVVLEAPSSTPGAAQPAPALAAGELLLRRRRRARLRARGGGRGAARPAGAAGGVRGRRGLGAVRGHGVLERGRLQRAGDLPRAAQQRVRDPQVVRRASSGSTGAPGLDLPALDTAAIARATGSAARRVEGARRAARGAGARRSAPGGPSWSRSGSRPGCGSSEPLLDPTGGSPRGAEPDADRAPDWVAAGTPEPLRGELDRAARRRPGAGAGPPTSSATRPTPAPTG